MVSRVTLSNPIPVLQRPYVSGHPIALLISIGFVFSGFVGLLGLVVPGLVSESAVALVLPEFVYAIFNTLSLFGGVAAAFGIVSGRRDVEAFGMSLLASVLFSYFMTIIAVRPSSAIQIQFILWLGIGCALRVWHLTRPDASDGGIY